MRPAIPAPLAPVVYDPAYEIEEEDETQTKAGLLETLHGISETTFKDSGHAIRSVHAKSHGLLQGQLRVFSGLPPVLAQGIFSKPGTWPVVIRLSTTPGDVLDDNVSTPRGMALKVIGVDGAREEGSEDAGTQDFVLVNGPAFMAPGAKQFLGSLKLLAATTDKVPGLKKALSAALRGTEKMIEAVGGESAAIKGLGGHPKTHPLGETYYSQVPILFGPYMAKISVAPVSPELAALAGVEVDLDDRANGLRDAVIGFFAGNSAVWEVRIQLCTDLDAMPIEDASVQWPEERSPYLAVGHITVRPQDGWSEALSRLVDDGMSFNPWHCIAAHRPIGSIMRIRKAAYEMSSRFRAQRNGVAMREPESLADFPPLL